MTGIGLGAAAVAALAALTDCHPGRADLEELALARDEALSAADSQGSFAGGNLKAPIVLGRASEGNADLLISALQGVGIRASVAGDDNILVDLADHLKGANVTAENVMYEELLSCGLILSPARQSGTYHALRAHYDADTVVEIAQRFERFLARMGRAEASKASTVDIGETNGVVNDVVDTEITLQMETPLPKASAGRGTAKTKPKTAAKTTGRGRKRKPADDADETESTQTEEILATIVSGASALKTPSSRRRSVAVEISEEVTSTLRKSRRRTLD